MTERADKQDSWFLRILLPGLVFKGVVIGGGYATGRELVEFFFSSGARGALLGMLVAMVVWSLVCMASFTFAHVFRTHNYRDFFEELLGPFWILFELAYVALIILIIAVIAAAAGATGQMLFGLPVWVGTVLLMAAIVTICTFGSLGVERLFRFTSLLLYVVYAIFLVLALTRFGDRATLNIAQSAAGPSWGWNGLLYASYNVVAVVAVLPFLKHQRSRRDAVLSGLLAGPLAMLPGLLFGLAMTAFIPAINSEQLPSKFLLEQIGFHWFTLLFNLMLFAALLETGVGGVNAITERAGAAFKSRFNRDFPAIGNLSLAFVIVFGSGVVATAIGLVDLIAQGYSAFAYVMLAIFIIPLFAIGLFKPGVIRKNSEKLGVEV